MFQPGKQLRLPKEKVRKAIVPGGQFRFRSSRCGKKRGHTFGRAWSNQLAVELVEVLPETKPMAITTPLHERVAPCPNAVVTP